MPQVSSLRERHRDRSTTRLAVTIAYDVSPAERVDAHDVSRRLRARTYAASRRPALDETA